MEHKKLTPHFFFLSIGVLATLIASVASFLSLVFATLDQVFPDVLTSTYEYGYASYSYEGMRNALAILLIVFPVFLILSRYWQRAMRKEMSHWDSIIRKWVLYLILFLAGVTVTVDLVILVKYFVSGELTVRFILKVVAVLIVAALCGWYYIRQVTGKARAQDSRILAPLSGVLVVGIVMWGFAVMGSPFAQRELRLDQRRVEDLQSIQWQVINYWQQKEYLPKSFSDLADPITNYSIPRDPEFQMGRQYEYSVTGDKQFELCATFTRSTPVGWVSGGSYGMGTKDAAVPMPYGGMMSGESWKHDEGHACFTRTIDPDIYPPIPKQKR